jgi:hypothetical protein
MRPTQLPWLQIPHRCSRQEKEGKGGHLNVFLFSPKTKPFQLLPNTCATPDKKRKRLRTHTPHELSASVSFPQLKSAQQTLPVASCTGGRCPSTTMQNLVNHVFQRELHKNTSHGNTARFQENYGNFRNKAQEHICTRALLIIFCVFFGWTGCELQASHLQSWCSPT